MKSIALSAVALAAIVAPTLASDLKVINYRTIPHQKPRNRAAVPSKRSLAARSSPLQVDLGNFEDVLYSISLGVGSPAQNISVQIDTGSSDLWFPVTGSQICHITGELCGKLGSYNPKEGSPKDLGKVFEIEYGGGTIVRGEFLADSVVVGSATLTSVQFAACTTGTSTSGVQGIMGIGYENGETTVEGAGSREPGAAKYDNVVANMVSQGVINSMAYSLWLNDPDSADGNVLFGGIDTAKYTAPLISMPVVPDAQTGTYDTLSLPLTAIAVSADGQSFTFTSSTFASPALIDSGTTLMYLPNDVVNAIWDSLQVVVAQDETPVLPCSLGNDPSAKVTFTFNGNNGAKIDVLLNDLLAPIDGTLSGEPACELLLTGGGPDGLVILGDAFMRSAYITYDLTNNMIAIAQTKFNVSDSNIVEIASSGIPSASVMATLVSGLASQTGAAVTELPGAGATGVGSFSTSAGSSGLESTARPPTFGITNTAAPASTATGSGTHKNAAPSLQSPVISIIGALTCTVTLMSFLGGAMMVWF